MARSMTGYGRAEINTESRKIQIEIKSVNNRYADFNIRMPRKFSFLEAAIRSYLKESIQRGKVDVFIVSEEFGEGVGSLRMNEALASEYIENLRFLKEKYSLAGDISCSDLIRAPEVFTIGEASSDEEEIWNLIEPVLKDACCAFNESRHAEGERLKADLFEKLDELYKTVAEVEEHEPEIMNAYTEKLRNALTELLEGHDVEEQRITAEAVLYADKISTDEECVRLKSHIVQMREELLKEGSIGRKLDFITQEMNREANTTLSKAGDLITADLGITMKTLIEKIREQIQNIE